MLHVSTNIEFIEGDVYYVQRNERSCALVSERNQIYIRAMLQCEYELRTT